MEGPAGGSPEGLTVAVEGCGHGDLDNIYATIKDIESRQRIKVDLLIICGDFEAVRNEQDLETMAVPPKYRHMGDFPKYYAGEAQAPVPTLFIGGNHEASAHLWELYYGGFAAPGMYYLGHAGVVRFGGLRIAGLSGIFKSHDYRKGHFERPPYTASTMRSAYHVRELEVYRLMQLREPVDVGLSHDWPSGIVEYGDKHALLRAKPYFRDEVERNELGSPPAMSLLRALRPRFWFSAHMHCKFPAVVHHDDSHSHDVGANNHGDNTDIDINNDHPHSTRFLSLDKCLPKRHFLQIVHFPEARGPREFRYDAEWLAVLRGTHHLMSTRMHAPPMPTNADGTLARPGASPEDRAYVDAALEREGPGVAPFTPTVPPHRSGQMGSRPRQPESVPVNPQAVHLMSLIGRDYNLSSGGGGGADGAAGVGAVGAGMVSENPEEIDLGDDVIDGDDCLKVTEDVVGNEEEIAIDEEG